MIGVVFAEEAEAKTFYKKVTGRKAEKCRSHFFCLRSFG